MDSSKLSELHDQYYPMLYRYVHFRLEDEQDVEDIISDVFLALLKSMQKNKRIRDLRAWLLGAASNRIHEYLRRKYRMKVENIEDQEIISASLSFQNDLEEYLSNGHIRSALQKLTDEQQHVLALRFSQGLSLEETACIMGKSVNAVKSLQFRAISSLRRLMDGGSGL